MALDQTKEDVGSRAGAPLPKLCDQGHVVIITWSYVQTTGSAVVMRNLLSRFDPASYTLVVSDMRGPALVEPDPRIAVHPFDVTIPDFVPGRWEHLWQQHQPFVRSRVKRLVKSLSPAVIVGLYPDLEFLQFAQRTARDLRIPWIAYLHNGIVDAMERTKYGGWAKRLQPKVLSEASGLMAVDNLAKHYTDTYGIVCKSMPIAYPEPIPDDLIAAQDMRKEAFWGGGIYEINARGLKRLLTALEEVKCPLALRTVSTDDTLQRYDITGGYVRREEMTDRPDYLEALRRRGVLVSALDWPDESGICEEELTTMFPTKVTEYLPAASPILVHCPEHYFLAQFFREHKCGLVVSDRDPKALTDAIRRLLEGGEEVLEMRRNALAAARLFAIDRIAGSFQSEINAVSRLRWGEKASS